MTAWTTHDQRRQHHHHHLDNDDDDSSVSNTTTSVDNAITITQLMTMTAIAAWATHTTTINDVTTTIACDRDHLPERLHQRQWHDHHHPDDDDDNHLDDPTSVDGTTITITR